MLKRNHTHNILNDKGQTIVEFSLVVTLLLAILFGIAEFGRAWFYSNQLTNAVRAAARHGAVYPADDDAALITEIDTYLRNEIGLLMNAEDIDTVSINVANKDGGDSAVLERGDIIHVRVIYNFNFLVGSYFVEEIFNKDTTWQLERSASMQYEEGV